MPIQSKQEKETKFCAFGKIQIKEDKKDYHVSGFVATSHPDRAENGEFAGDIIPKSTLQKVVTDINNKYKPQAGAASERHDHLKGDPDAPIAGIVTEPASLQELENGEWGVHVDTILSTTNPRFEDVKTNIEEGTYPGFSIEYVTNDFVPTEKEGKKYRILTDIDTEGFGYANRRMIANPHAEVTSYGYKEINTITDSKEKDIAKLKKLDKNKKKKPKGDDKMDKKEELENQAKEILKEMEGKEVKEIEEKMKEELIPETIYKELLPAAQDDPAKPQADPAIKETGDDKQSVSKEDFDLLISFKETKEKEAQMKEITESKEFKEQVAAEIKEARKVKAPVLQNEKGNPEFKELISYKESMEEIKELDKHMESTTFGVGMAKRKSLFDRTIDRQFKESARLTDALMTGGVPVWNNWMNKTPIPSPSNMKEGVNYSDNRIETYGSRLSVKEFSRIDRKEIEMKAGGGLGVTNATNANLNLADSSWTYGSYFLSPVELNDIFSPVLVNQLNDQTTTYGRLNKVDFSGRSQITFRARTGQNSTVGGYKEGVNLTYGSSFTGNIGRKKFQQPFAYYRVLLAITGQAMRLGQAPGGMGDVWADEIKWSGVDLLSKDGTGGTAATGLNRAILSSGDGTAEDISLGFEGLILGTTGTLYGKELSAEATLRSHKETVTTSITLEQLRKMKRLTETGDGTGSSQIHSSSAVADMVYFTHHLQRDRVKAILQDQQRTAPTSGRVGFEGEIELDGVPIVPDRMINTDDVFLINTANTRIGVNLPPTLEPLPVTADAQAAQIKTYWNLYSDAPGNNYWTDGFSTS